MPWRILKVNTLTDAITASLWTTKGEAYAWLEQQEALWAEDAPREHRRNFEKYREPDWVGDIHELAASGLRAVKGLMNSIIIRHTWDERDRGALHSSMLVFGRALRAKTDLDFHDAAIDNEDAARGLWKIFSTERQNLPAKEDALATEVVRCHGGLMILFKRLFKKVKA